MLVTFKIYNSINQIPDSWDNLAVANIFLSKKYLEILDKSAPANMVCLYIGFFQNNQLVGICLSQFIDANQLDSFGDRDKCLKTAFRNFFFKNFCSHVLFIGNNMLTGQNAFNFNADIDKEEISKSIKKLILDLKNNFKTKGTKIHITTIKDFDVEEINIFQKIDFKEFYKFTIQPNMVLEIPEFLKSEQDYIDSLIKKYRDQYKRSRKKSEGITKHKMNLTEIQKHEKTIYDLYFHVAKNAPFNMFFLSKNHFSVMKEILKEDFLFYGYFINETLIGFNTLIKNGTTLDTYFLGYDNAIQRDKMLYLNMLYDMTVYAINKNFKEIVFARTALEIKSSVGAKPHQMFGLIAHSNPIFNKFMNKIFPFLEPETIWQQRSPFK
jgi:hypothetical protein